MQLEFWLGFVRELPKENQVGDIKCSIRGAFVLRIPEFQHNKAALSAD